MSDVSGDAPTSVRVSFDERTLSLAPGARCVIGRSSECDLVVSDRRVSRRHAEIFDQGGRWYLRDLGSTRGTFADGQQVTDPLDVTGIRTIRLVDPQAGPMLALSRSPRGRRDSSDRSADPTPDVPPGDTAEPGPSARPATAPRGGRRRWLVATLVVLVVAGVAVRWWPSSETVSAERRWVTVTTDRGGIVVHAGGGIVVDGERRLVVAAAPLDSAAGDDETARNSYRVLLGGDAEAASAAAVEVGRTDELVVLRLVGLDAAPTVAERLRALGPAPLAENAPRGSSVDLLSPADADAIAAGTGARAGRIAGERDGDALAIPPAAWAWPLASAPLVDGDRLIGFAGDGCNVDDRIRMRWVTIDGLVEALDSVEAADDLAGPAPTVGARSPLPTGALPACA